MEEVLGHGKIVVEVEENVRAELAKAEAAFERTMAKLDRQEAELKLGANTAEFYEKVRKAQADLKKWEATKADATLGVDTKSANAGIANAKRRLQEYEKSNVKSYNRIQQLDENRTAAAEGLADRRANAERKVTAATEKEAAKRQSSADKEAAAVERAAQREATAREKAAERTARAAERSSQREQAASDRAAKKRQADMDRDREQSAGLQRQYIDLARRRERISGQSRKALTPQSERIRMELDTKHIDQQMLTLRARLNAIGEPPPEIDLHIKDNNGAATLSKWANALSDTAVRVGPFTSSVGGAARALALLGPIITGIIGTVLAAGSALGAALGGGIGIASAALVGFVPLVGLTATTMVPLIKELKNANQAQSAYDKAVREHGKDSKEAAKKLKILQSVTKSMSGETRNAVRQWSDLKTTWKAATQDAAKRSFGTVVSEGLKTASSLMPMLANQTTSFMDHATKGISGWMKGLRSAGGKSVLDNIFGNVNASIEPIMGGLGQLGAAAGKVLSVFSDFLPGLSGGFEKWATSLNKAASNTDNVRSKVEVMVDSMKAVGSLAKSTGRLLFNFMMVGAGSGGGANMLRDMARGIDDINSSMMRGGGKGLASFFQDSISTGKELYGVLKPIATLFMEWATIMRPFTSAMLQVSKVFAEIVSSISESGIGRGFLTAAFGVFLGGQLIGKVKNVSEAIRALIGTIKTLGATSVAMRLGDVMTGGAFDLVGRRARAAEAQAAESVAAGAAGRTAGAAESVAAAAGGQALGTKIARGTAKADVAMAKTAANAGKLRGAMTGLVEGGAAFGPWGLAIGAGAAAASFGIYKLITAESDQEKAQKQAAAGLKTYNSAIKALPNLHAAAASSGLQFMQSQMSVRDAQKEVNRLQKAGKTGTEEYKVAQMNLRGALIDEYSARQQLTTAAKQEGAAKKALYDGAQKDLKGTANEFNALAKKTTQMSPLMQFGKTMGDAFKNVQKQAKDANVPVKDFIKSMNLPDAAKKDLLKMANSYGKVGDAAKVVEAAQRQMALATLNQSRALQGMLPLAGKAATALLNLQKVGGKNIAVKIATKFEDPKDAQRVANSAAATLKSGTPKSVTTKIVADAKNANDAIRQLQRVRITPKRVQILESGGKEAVSMIERIIGRKLPQKIQHIIEKGGSNAISMIEALIGKKLPQKTQHVKEAGSSGVMGWLSRILGTKFPTKTVTVKKNDSGILGWLGSIWGALSRIPAVKTITTVFKQIGKPKGNFDGGRPSWFATGGMAFDRQQPNDGKKGMVEKAAEIASRRQPLRTQGGKYARPTMLVGEENRSEYVIATNPAYRVRNKRFLAAAASDFGMNLTDNEGNQVRSAATGAFAGSGYYMNTNTSSVGKNLPPTPAKGKALSRAAKKAKTSRKKYAFGARRGWATYVEGLQTQQDNLGREVSIRESQIREPEDMVIQTGTQPVKDPETGEVTQVPTYGPNPKIESEYKPDIAKVMQAMDMLLAVIAELVRAIPQAITANRIERGIRDNVIHSTNAEISKENHRWNGLSKKERAKTERQHAHTKRLERLHNVVKENEDTNKTLRDDEKTLGAAQIDAGFDFREATIDRQGMQSEYDTAEGKAAADASAQTTAAASTGSGGGGGSSAGSGSTGPSLSQQNSMADTERAAVLQQFGGNMFNSLGSKAGSPGAGGGMQTNLAGAATAAFSGGAATMQKAATAVAGATGGVQAALTGGGAAAVKSARAATAATSAAAAPGTPTSTGDTTKNINIVNNFQAPPADPHTWSAGVAFEAAAVL